MAEMGVGVEMPKPKVTERAAWDVNGWPVAGAALLVLVGGVVQFTAGIRQGQSGLVVLGIVLFIAALIVAAGLTPVSPGRARVLQILGRYAGTIRTDGLRWVNPLATRREVSTRIRNHETAVAKVNDADGNPTEIAAVVVWQVEDTAQAMFGVDDFVEFVAIQTETAGMVELALDKLSERQVVELDEERKAAMVSNLMVVLCGDRDAQPVLNTGSLYQ